MKMSKEKFPMKINSTKKIRKGMTMAKNANEKRYVYRVEINTMADAKELVAISTKLDGQITLQSGNKFAVNAKSLLGVLLAKKLNWDDLRIVMENDHYHTFDKFIKS